VRAHGHTVGSLITRRTLRPAISPASLVACLCESLKYAGTVTTAFLTGVLVYDSAVSFILVRTKAPTWEGEYSYQKNTRIVAQSANLSR
jgi:hypothetical protein